MANEPMELIKNVKVVWPEIDSDISMANVFALQATPDGVVLTIGQASQPIITGTAEEVRAAVDAVTEVVARPIARVAMTEERVQELFQSIGQILVGLVQAGVASPAIVESVTEMPEGATQ